MSTTALRTVSNPTPLDPERNALLVTSEESQNPMYDFNNTTVIVTGGTRSIGKAISRLFIESGARVIATYLGNTAAAEEFKSEINSPNLFIERFDVSDYTAVESFFADFTEKYGTLEVLVNNSGIRRDAVLAMMSPEDFNRVLQVNLGGVYNMCKFAVKEMLLNRYGRIINMTSPSGKFGFEGQCNYSASKAGMVALSRSLSKEVAKRKITVNCVSPGFIDTDLLSDLPPELVKEYKNSIPVKRFGTPEDIAHAVAFLATRESSYITGSTLEVTGGL